MFNFVDKILIGIAIVLSIALGVEYIRVKDAHAAAAKAQVEFAQSKTDLANYKESVAETARLLQASNDKTHIAQLNQVLEAKNAAEARNTQLAADAAGTQSQLDSLRRAVRLAARRDRLPQSPAAPDSQLLPIASQLLVECATAYGELAKQADAIASDRQALIDSWPK